MDISADILLAKEYHNNASDVAIVCNKSSSWDNLKIKNSDGMYLKVNGAQLGIQVQI